MFSTIIFYLFMIIGMVNVAHMALYLVGANTYDILAFRKKVKKRGQFRRNDRASILIPAHNEEKTITRCLDSVLKSTMRDLEIVVIDDASTDNTAAIVEKYIRNHCDFNRHIRLIKLYENAGKAGALNRALEQGLKGKFVMTLDADSVLHPKAIQNAVEYFYEDPYIVGVAANVRVMENQTILSLLQKFEYMIGYRSKKFYTISNSEFIIGGVGSTYRYSILKGIGFYDDDVQTEDIALSLKIAALGNKKFRLVYGADVVAMTEGVSSFKALLRQRYRWKLGGLQAITKHRNLIFNSENKYSRAFTWYRMPITYVGEMIVLIEPIIVSYILYLSLRALTPQNFLGAYILITLYILWTIWPDEHMSFKKKLTMTAYTPVMYFLFYIINIVQFFAVIRCIVNVKQITLQKPTSSIWTSPSRTGHAAGQFNS